MAQIGIPYLLPQQTWCDYNKPHTKTPFAIWTQKFPGRHKAHKTSSVYWKCSHRFFLAQTAWLLTSALQWNHIHFSFNKGVPSIFDSHTSSWLHHIIMLLKKMNQDLRGTPGKVPFGAPVLNCVNTTAPASYSKCKGEHIFNDALCPKVHKIFLITCCRQTLLEQGIMSWCLLIFLSVLAMLWQSITNDVQVQSSLQATI